MQIYNYIKFLEDYHIDYELNNRGYAEIICPFCSSNKRKGGFHPYKGYNCWKCGFTRTEDVVRALTGIEWHQIEKDYHYEDYYSYLDKKAPSPTPNTELSLPYGVGELLMRHKNYLKSRNYDPDYIISKYHIKATNHLGDYAFRIVIPIYYKHQLVSYTCRDWTGNQDLRYMSCKIEDEVIHHKHILYNMDNCNGSHGVIVEGSTDVWRLGDGSMATLGTGFTQQQIVLIARTFKRITLIYDAEEEAKIRANKLGNTLAGMGLEVDMLLLKEGDPGNLAQDEANAIMEEILK